MKIINKQTINDRREYWDMTIPDTHNYVLANGCVVHNTGVGFSVERDKICHLPTVAEDFHQTDTTLVVADSKLGWAKAFRELIGLLYSGQIPRWDLTKLRPAGAPLKTMGGRSSGPEPLDSLFKYAVATFKSAAGRKLNSLECHDLVCKIGEVVVVGGVRRSALISLSNVSDDRLRHAKSGQWWIQHPERTLANNSACYTEKPDVGVFMDEWKALYESKSGERGIFNRAAAKVKAAANERRNPAHDWGVNPCVTGDTRVLTSVGSIPIATIVENPKSYLIASYNEKLRKIEYEVPTFGDLTRIDAHIIELELEDGTTLRLTPDHRVYTENRGYIQASLLTSDDILITEITQTLRRQHIKRISLTPNADTYDLTMPKNHNFFANGVLVHNCGEILLRDREFCNLSEVVARYDDSEESLLSKVQMAAMLGTFQASLTNFKYVSAKWKQNCEEEALLGVSLTGIMDCPLLNGTEPNLADRLERLKAAAIETNKHWAAKLGIKPAAAVTCVKPSGTVSQLVDSSSGIHARHAEYYIRTVRMDRKDPLTAMMIEKKFPHEEDVTNPHAVVFSFPTKAPLHKLDRSTAVQQLEFWLLYKNHWCEHNPSVTISVKEHEWLTVGAWVYEHFDQMCGVSFLPYSEHSYRQAPYQECSEADYIEFVKKMPAAIDWTELSQWEHDDQTTGTQTLACSAGGCDL